MASEQIVVRLPSDLAADLRALSSRVGRTRSAVVRDALAAFLRAGVARRPADRVRDLVGSLASRVPNLAEEHRRYLLAALRRGR